MIFLCIYFCLFESSVRLVEMAVVWWDPGRVENFNRGVSGFGCRENGGKVSD